jgi:hypothetical protein
VLQIIAKKLLDLSKDTIEDMILDNAPKDAFKDIAPLAKK